jgi:hypothetical protein
LNDNLLTQERVRELFDYREDGALVWKVAQRGGVKAGSMAGGLTHGYAGVRIAGRHYYIHRVVWLWHCGYMPEGIVDHINRDPLDNRVENLREVSHSCNHRNTTNNRANTSGVKGVYRTGTDQMWRAQIKVAGRILYLGRHTDFLEAVCHRLAAEQAEGWAGCDDCSPAFKYVRQHIPRDV